MYVLSAYLSMAVMIFQCKIANFISSLENGEWAEKNVDRVRYTLPLYMTLPTCCASATTDLSRIGMPGKIGSGWMRDPFARLEITAWRRRTCYCFFFSSSLSFGISLFENSLLSGFIVRTVGV
jgi:hypothetical protein